MSIECDSLQGEIQSDSCALKISIPPGFRVDLLRFNLFEYAVHSTGCKINDDEMTIDNRSIALNSRIYSRNLTAINYYN